MRQNKIKQMEIASEILNSQFTGFESSFGNRRRAPCKCFRIPANISVFQGWCSGESARLPLICPGFDSRSRRHMWVEFVVGSCPCSERFFSGYSGFPLSSKTNISKFQFDPEPESHRFVSPRLFGVTLVKQS